MQNLASRSLVDDVLKKVTGLKPIADELGVPLSQLAIAWCASNPNVSSVITGATKEYQVIIMCLYFLVLFCYEICYEGCFISITLYLLLHFHFRIWIFDVVFKLLRLSQGSKNDFISVQISC